MADPLKQGAYGSDGVPDTQALDDLEVVMVTESGRRHVWRQIKRSNLMTDPMTGNSMTFYNCGQQSVGRELVMVLNTERFLHLYRKMQDEALQAEKANTNKEK